MNYTILFMDHQKLTEEALNSYMRYQRLSKFLFADPDNSPYNINEMDSKNEFYNEAKALAAKMGIDWEKMDHQESNRVMLARLEHCYQSMRLAKSVVIDVTVKLYGEKKDSENGGKKASPTSNDRAKSKG